VVRKNAAAKPVRLLKWRGYLENAGAYVCALRYASATIFIPEAV
jgi:hypothetical protein